MIKKIYFINTFEPVVSIYRDVLPRLEKMGVRACAIISNGSYCDRRQNTHVMARWKRVWVPSTLRHRRRWCNIFYWLFTPFVLLRISKSVIIFLSQPPLFYLIGSAIARLRGNKYYLHIMDLYPDLLGQVGLLQENGFAYRIISKLSLKAFRKAEKVIVIGRCMKRCLIKRGVDPNKIVIVPNWADSSIEQYYDNGLKFRNEHRLQSKFIVMYSGNMGFFHDFSTLLKVAKQLKDNPQIIFIFVGGGVRRKEIEAVKAAGLSNILLLPAQPIELLAETLSAADLHFVSLREGFEGLLVPSKFYNIIASGRPVLYEGNIDGEIAQTIEENKCGLVIHPGNNSNLYEAIIYYLFNKPAWKYSAKQAKKLYDQKYVSNKSIKKYISTLTSVRGSNF